MLKCPIYNAHNACDVNPDCLFLRNAGCAIVLGATATFENQEKIGILEQQLNTIDHNLRLIAQSLKTQLRS